MNRLRIAKLIVGGIASYGAGIIITSAIANNTNTQDLPTYKKIAVLAGGIVIGTIVKEAVGAKTDALIDDMVRNYGKVMTKINEAKAAA